MQSKKKGYNQTFSPFTLSVSCPQFLIEKRQEERGGGAKKQTEEEKKDM
jgi:hypothetical protein